MSSGHVRGTLPLPDDRLLHRAVVLAWVTVAGAVVLVPVAVATRGWPGLEAAGAGATACLAGSVGALVLAERFFRVGHPLAGVLAGMMVRMAVPLAAVMFVYWQGSPLVQGGMVFYLLAFYMITLLAETWMAVDKTMRGNSLPPPHQVLLAGDGTGLHGSWDEPVQRVEDVGHDECSCRGVPPADSRSDVAKGSNRHG